MANDLTFIVRRPDGAETAFYPGTGTIRVGRDGGADLVLEDPLVSRLHAELEPDGRGYRVRNLSERPLLLNGERAGEGRMVPGDEIRVGDTILTLVQGDSESDETRLALLSEIVNVLPREVEMGAMLDRVLAALFRIMDIRRAFVALRSGGDGALEVVASMNREQEGAQVEVSRTILAHVLERREGLLASNAMVDPAFRAADSVIDLQIRSVLCVPIPRGDEAIGVLYGDNRERERSFGPADLRFLTLVARILAVLIENLRFAEDLREENVRLKRLLEGEGRLVGSSPGMKKLRQAIHRAATTDATILITGETGTGKNLVAETIHEMSRRADEPYVEVSCAAIPETLLEAELFGYGPKSGISGADPGGRQGRFEAAGGGSLLLDEIADMSHALQAKILQVIEARKFTRLGMNVSRDVRCRILAATNRDLGEAVKEGAFRKDLYYRLRVIPIHMSPLRDRPEDILPIAEHFLRALAPERKVRLSPAARQVLLDHVWPGNAREIRNALEHALALGDRRTIEPQQLRAFLSGQDDAADTAGDKGTDLPPLEDVLREHVLRTLRHHAWNKRRAAQSLGISRSTLYEWIRRLGLAEEDGEDA